MEEGVNGEGEARHLGLTAALGTFLLSSLHTGYSICTTPGLCWMPSAAHSFQAHPLSVPAALILLSSHLPPMPAIMVPAKSLLNQRKERVSAGIFLRDALLPTQGPPASSLFFLFPFTPLPSAQR